MSTYKRGRVWWFDFTDPTSKVRYRESTHQRDEVIADLMEARRKLQVGEASRQALLASLQLPAVAALPVVPSQMSRLEAALTKATDDPRPRISIGALRDEWLRAKAGKKTVEEDRAKFKRFLEWLGDETVLIHELTSERFRDYFDALYEDNQPATINRHLAVLRGAFNLAKKKGYRQTDPFATISQLPENNERDRIATDEEYAALVAAAVDPRIKLAIILARETGMRRTEIATVSPKHYREKPEPHLVLSGAETKNGEGRVVPLNKKAVKAWKQYGGKGVQYSPSHLTNTFTALCEELKIDGLRLHDMRGTFATELLQEGVDSVMVSRLTGHKDIATLNKRYARLGDKSILEIHKNRKAKK